MAVRSDEPAAILSRELRRGDMSGNPMAAVLATVLLAAFLAFMGWLAVTVTGLQESTADLRGEVRANQVQTTARIDALSADVAELKADQSEIRKLLVEAQN